LLDAYITSSSSSNSSAAAAKKSSLPRTIEYNLDDGPIAKLLPPLNLGLCVVLVGLGAVVERRHEVWWGFGWLPGLIWGVVLLAKWIMGGVDPEGELDGLRYRYKGA
jgi:hypothetical protein